MATRPTLDQARQRHADERAVAVVRQYCAAHPTGVIQQKISDGTLTPSDAYRLLKEVARDPKTGVDRADLLAVTLEHEIHGAREHHWPLSVAVVDIDDFKAINTELTHVGADEVLREIATIQREVIRTNDDILPGEGSVVRWGGEEFVVLLIGADAAAAQRVAERLREKIAAHFIGRRANGRPITVSIGVAEWDPERTPQWTDLITLADERLLRAKTKGKNVVVSK